MSFRFDTGSRGRHDLPEIMGGGVALFDADGDGRLDIYLCNGGPIEPTAGQARPCLAGSIVTKVAAASKTSPIEPPRRARATRWGRLWAIMTATAALDLFVTGWRDQRLYRNLGGGRFQDVTIRAGGLVRSLEHVGGLRGSRWRRRPGPLRGELSRF